MSPSTSLKKTNVPQCQADSFDLAQDRLKSKPSIKTSNYETILCLHFKMLKLQLLHRNDQ